MANTITGIYIITNKLNGKIYVGSSVNIKQRWLDHKKQLRANRHNNKHLQHAWNKYGELSFIFSLVEHTNKDQLVQREQYWIDQTLCTHDSIGYNISPSAGSNRGSKRTDEYKQRRSLLSQKTWEGFINPDGELTTIVNLKRFCRDNNLDITVMTNLSSGRNRCRSHRGWTHVNTNKSTRRKTSATFIDPLGNEVYVDNVSKWINMNQFNRSTVYAVIRGTNKSFSGWVLKIG